MTRDEIHEFLARRRDAFRRHDAEALAADHATDGLLQSPAGGTVQGRDAILNVYRAFFQAFPDVTLEDEEPIIDGERVSHLTTMTGTHVGDFLGMPPTGKQFRFRMARFYEFADGAIASERRIYDFTGMLLQIGVLKAKPA